MLTLNGDDVRQSSLAAKRSLFLLSIFALLLVGVLVVERVYYQASMAAIDLRKERANHARAAILLADEKLTMSALAYAGTADEAMRARYEASLPEIDTAIASAKQLVAPEIASRFDRETRVANDKLVALEAKAFLYAGRGNTGAAQQIFKGADYRINKLILADGSERMLAALYADLQAHTDRVSLIRKIVLGFLSLLAVLAFATLIRRVRSSLNSSETAFFSAMAEMEASEKEAIDKARRDAMVGLPNRVSLLEALTRDLQTSFNVTLLYIDLDGFKTVNDTYGHETGDHLLQRVSRSFEEIVGAHGLLARLGGDEFAILLSGTDAAQTADQFCTQIHTLFAKPFDIDGRIANIGASIGVATVDEDSLDSIELMRRADVAMYEAKNTGRNRRRDFDVEIDRKRRNDFEVAAEMRSLVARGEFEVAYQPIVESQTAKILGVEVLARWPAASPRKLNPDYFIKVAEEHGVIDDLGALILDIACRDTANIDGLRLAVNVSPLQLNNPGFINMLVATAQKHDFDLKRLDIELTENVLIRYPERAKQVISAMQALGITVSLDDFGTGFASVGYLREFGFDNVKLDQSLTQAILTDASAQQVVQGTILIASGLSATTIAEGVETLEESDVMRLLGCKQLQGYYYGRPASLDKFEIAQAAGAAGSSIAA
jgi:diguanylate cyclase (GGDEF)-like protein